MSQTPKALALRAAKALWEKKAQEPLVLEIGHLTIIADCMVIAGGQSMVQVKALADHLEEALAADGVRPARREGYAEGRWIVLDYGSVIVHIFHEQEREYYHLERLWADGTNAVPFEPEVAEPSVQP